MPAKCQSYIDGQLLSATWRMNLQQGQQVTPQLINVPNTSFKIHLFTRVKIVLLVMLLILLNLFHVWMVPCTGILFEWTVGVKHTTRLSKETKCSVDMETIEGMRKHRKVTLRAEETHDLQVVAWRLQERKWMDSAMRWLSFECVAGYADQIFWKLLWTSFWCQFHPPLLILLLYVCVFLNF